MKNRFKNIVTAADGVVAIEMALILPIMLMLFFGMLEYNRAMFHHQKVNKISSTIGDMISMSKPLDVDKLDADLVKECATEPLVLTENRLLEIISGSVVETLALPIKTDKVVVYVSSVYKDPSRPAEPAKVKWRYSYNERGDNQFINITGAINSDANLPTVTIGSVPVGLYDGESMIVVEAGVKYNPILGQSFEWLIPSLEEGWFVNRNYFSARSYLYNASRLPKQGLNYIWPHMPSVSNGLANRIAANPNGC